MKPFEKILVPIDFGQHSAEAMRRAVDVAGHYGASLTLVYVYEPLDYALPEGYALYTPEQVGQLLDDFRERLRAAAREVEGMGAPAVAHEVLTGPAASEIVEYARAHGMDLIVMGTHGRRGLSHLLMGSVAERVLRTAPCPVLTVKVDGQVGHDADAHAKGKAA
jgi:nucleotide-binding universal stress UspA family protein